METSARTAGSERAPQAQAEPEFAITHFFAAPRETVFRMVIDPLVIPRWWGPAGRTTEVGAMHVEPRGEWRFIQYDDEGGFFGFHGVYEAVEFPERLSYSFEYEGQSGEDRTETLTFSDEEGHTRLTVTATFEGRQAYEDSLAAGLREDWAGSLERLAGLLGEKAF